jgi:CTP synthase (UTP-ammonia lyase)
MEGGQQGMSREISVGIIGDFNAKLNAHRATNDAIQHAADQLSIKASTVWLPTPSFLTEDGRKKLGQVDAVWAPPGSYASFEGALRGIQLVRESGKPFIGT